MCFSSCKNCKLKVKLWWVGACERKRVHILMFILSEGNFFNMCILSQCIVYWIHFQNTHTSTYQKHYFRHFLLVFKIVESLQCTLKWILSAYCALSCCKFEKTFRASRSWDIGFHNFGLQSLQICSFGPKEDFLGILTKGYSEGFTTILKTNKKVYEVMFFDM